MMVPFVRAIFFDSDSSVDVKLIAFWLGAVSLILTIFCFCLSLLFLLFSFNLAHNCFRENLLFFFLQVITTKLSLLYLRIWRCFIFSFSLSIILLILQLGDLNRSLLILLTTLLRRFLIFGELILILRALIIWSGILPAAAQSIKLQFRCKLRSCLQNDQLNFKWKPLGNVLHFLWRSSISFCKISWYNFFSILMSEVSKTWL